MPSRQDQLHSYQFMVQRVVSALVIRETDPAQSPFRRVAVAALASLMFAMVGVAGFAVYGVFAGGSNANWKTTANAVIVEEETGASFVYRDGVLHPVRNLSSALLIAGGSAPNILSVGRSSLAGTPRGSLLGIADAPDAVPSLAQLATGSWTVCAISAKDATSGSTEQASLLAVGDRTGVPNGGKQLTEELGTLVTPDANADHVYLLWRNKKYQVRESSSDIVGLRALGMPGDVPRRVDEAFLNAISAGDGIEAPPLGPSGDSAFRQDVKVGDVFTVKIAEGNPQYFVAVADGLAEVTAVQANILGQSHATRELEAAQVPKQTRSLVPTGEGAPPRSGPKFVDTVSGGLCATTADDKGVRQIRFDVTVPDLTGLVRTAGQRKTTRAIIADYVLVEPGRGVLVEGYTTAGVSGGVVSLVTDLGQQFAIENAAARAALGYATATPVRMPITLVALLPQGPRLDADDAGQAVTLS